MILKSICQSLDSDWNLVGLRIISWIKWFATCTPNKSWSEMFESFRGVFPKASLANYVGKLYWTLMVTRELATNAPRSGLDWKMDCESFNSDWNGFTILLIQIGTSERVHDSFDSDWNGSRFFWFRSELQSGFTILLIQIGTSAGSRFFWFRSELQSGFTILLIRLEGFTILLIQIGTSERVHDSFDSDRNFRVHNSFDSDRNFRTASRFFWFRSELQYVFTFFWFRSELQNGSFF